MRLAKLEGAGFDLIGNENESSTTFVRGKDEVRMGWVDNGFHQLKKEEAATLSVGTLLIASGQYLLPTGDPKSAKTVGRVLATKDKAVETKQVTLLDGSTTQAYLLPVQVIQ